MSNETVTAEKSIPVSVRIMDKEYKISCPQGEHESLLASASLLNDKMREIQNNGKIIGAEKIAVIAAINIAHDLIRTKDQLVDPNIANRLDDIKSTIDATLKAMST
jgi:cell division protein ZapA